MTITINIHEAKTHFSKLIQRAMNGEEIIIAKAGKPVVVLSAFAEAPTTRVPGLYAGQIIIHDDFDDPLPDFDA
jgi:prevent-host-death family protein